VIALKPSSTADPATDEGEGGGSQHRLRRLELDAAPARKNTDFYEVQF